MDNRLIDFLSDLNRAETSQQVFETMIRHLTRAGFGTINYVYAERDPDGKITSCNHTTLRDAWIDYYEDEQFAEIDFGIQWILNRKPGILKFYHDSIPDAFTPTPRAELLWSYAREEGFGGFIGIPLADIGGFGAGGISIGSDLMTRREFDKAWELESGVLLSMVYIAHARMKHHYMSAEHLGLKLTPRQKQMVECLAQGASNKEIAHKLDMTEPTVSFHLKSTAERLGVRTTREILPRAIAHNLIYI